MASSEGTEIGNKIASEGGIEVFMKALRGFPDHEKVLAMNLNALGNVASGNPDNQVKIVEARGQFFVFNLNSKLTFIQIVLPNHC